MPPSQRNSQKPNAGVATPPPKIAPEQTSLSARERLRQHLQRNLKAQELKAQQLAEQRTALVTLGSGVTYEVSVSDTVHGKASLRSTELHSLYAPIEDTRLGVSDISNEHHGDGIPPLISESEANSGLHLNNSDLGIHIEESPPDFDTPPSDRDAWTHTSDEHLLCRTVSDASRGEWVDHLLGKD